MTLAMQTFGKRNVPVQRPWGRMGPLEKSVTIRALNSALLLPYKVEITNCGASSKLKTKPLFQKDSYG